MAFFNYAQTFYIHRDKVKGADIVYIPKVELAFKTIPKRGSKAAVGLDNPEVYVQLVECEVFGGEATPKIEKVVEGSFRSVSTYHANGAAIISTSGWTPFDFDHPVAINTDTPYALMVGFQGDTAYTLKINQVAVKKNQTAKDVQPLSAYVDGKLFNLADNNMAPLYNQDLMFRVYLCKFNTFEKQFEMLNDAMEFTQVTSVSNANTDITGFWGDEIVTDANTAAKAGTVKTDIITRVVQGNNTTFTTQFSAGDYIIMADYAAGVSNNDIRNAQNINILEIANVNSDTLLTLVNEPTFVNSAAYYYKSPVGRVFNHTESTGLVVLYDSNAANDTFRFTNNSVFMGLDSRTKAKVANVFNWPINRFNTEFYSIIPNQSEMFIRTSVASNTYVWSNSNFTTVKKGANTDFINYNAIVASRSNEVSNSIIRASLYSPPDPSGTVPSRFKFKSFVSRITMKTNNEWTSPRLRDKTADLLIYENLINNSIAGETGAAGNADTKYISKQIVLSDKLDAEDIRVYVNAFRPAGTDLKLFAKVINRADPAPFADKDWTPLELKNNIIVASKPAEETASGVLEQYVEFEYGFRAFPQAQTYPLYSASVTAATNTVNITTASGAANINSIFSVNDVVRIFNNALPNTSFIASVTATTNTSLTLSSTTSDTLIVGGGRGVAKVDYAHRFTAYNNSLNSNIVQYIDKSTFSKMDTYKSFAVKIVLTATSPAVVPRIADVRAIAVSA